jgi:CRISPR system Cascade subunit CasE
MAFPSASTKSADPHFLKPFDPQDFGADQVHVDRRRDAGFLFRIDPLRAARVAILVQSAVPPDWDYAFHNGGYLLAAPPEVRPYDPSFATGERLAFRLVANPTKRLTKNSRERDGTSVAPRWVGKRVPVPSEHLYEWLARRAAGGGFSIAEHSRAVQPGYVYLNKKADGPGQRLRSARYDGLLEVADPELFRKTVATGIGPGKAFGFGLLSVARVAEESG